MATTARRTGAEAEGIPASAEGRPLFERERELALLEQLLTRLGQGRGQIAIVEGPAGIGKTRLLGRVRAQARARGVAVLSARAGASDRQSGFGVARRLLDPVVRQRLAAGENLETLAGSAAPLFDSDAPRRLPEAPNSLPSPNPLPSSNPLATVDALCAILGRAAANAPLVVCVDDGHWVDNESLRVFVALANRLEELPVLLVVGARIRATGAAQGWLAALASDQEAVILRPAPLSERAVQAWIGHSLGAAQPGFAAACLKATGGNPFLVAELLRTLAVEGIAPSSENAPRVTGFAPEGISRAVFSRLARLPERNRRVASALSVLGGRAESGVLAELTGLEHEPLARAIDKLIDAEVLAKRDPPEFLHPIMSSAVYRDLALADRDALHLRAGWILSQRRLHDPDEIAAHLMATRPQGQNWIAQRLREAAAEAFRCSAPEAASRYLRRALQEPPADDDAILALVALGEADAARGEPRAAVQALSAALPGIEDPTDRADVIRALGQCLVRVGRGAEAAALLVEAVAALPMSAAETGLRLEADLEVIAHLDAHAGRNLEQRRPRFRRKSGTSTSPDERIALAGRADHEMNRGRASAAARFAQRALDGVQPLGPHGVEPVFFFSTAIAVLYSDHLDEAERIYDDAVASAEGRKQIWAAAVARGFRAGVHYRRGALSAGETDARYCLIHQSERFLGPGRTFASGFLVDILVDRGELGAAAAVLTDVGADGPLPDALISNLLQHARGRLRAAQSDHLGALADYAECERRAAEWDMRTPAVANWGASTARSLIALGRSEEARRRAAEGVVAARAFGSPRGLGIALTALGQTTGEAAALEEAIDVLRASPARLELGRALIARGIALRHEGRRSNARELLQEGLRIARASGAMPLAVQAHEELAATGGRPRKILRSGSDALTVSELRVARLAAAGHSNREIADRLTLSVRTIETHLARAYQKLDITSRQELQMTLTTPVEPRRSSPPRPQTPAGQARTGHPHE